MGKQPSAEDGVIAMSKQQMTPRSKRPTASTPNDHPMVAIKPRKFLKAAIGPFFALVLLAGQVMSEPVIAGEITEALQQYGWGIMWGMDYCPSTGQTLTCGSLGALLLNQDTGDPIRCMKPSGYPEAACLSPDGRIVAIAAISGHEVSLWDSSTGAKMRTVFSAANDERTIAVAFSPDGTRVLGGLTDGTARIWDAMSGEEILRLPPQGNYVCEVAFSPDGRKIVTHIAFGSAPEPPKIWDASNGTLLTSLNVPGFGTSFSPDGSVLAVGGWQNATSWICDVSTGEAITTFSAVGQYLTASSSCFTPDGKKVLFGYSDGNVRIWDSATAELIQTFSKHTGYINWLGVSADGTRVISGGSNDLKCQSWDIASGNEIWDFGEFTQALFSVAFSPDNTVALMSRFAGKWTTAGFLKLVRPVLSWDLNDAFFEA